ncbi:hypothetical protein, partial [Neisseria meningitidis]|uniref:hypothetical protein n=1 Tax=Neisseria meningitidis TaxID=487 RepID=UPI001E551087
GYRVSGIMKAEPLCRHSHKVGIQFFEFQSFPINCLSIECLDSRLRGNDGGNLVYIESKKPAP